MIDYFKPTHIDFITTAFDNKNSPKRGYWFITWISGPGGIASGGVKMHQKRRDKNASSF